MLVLTLGLFNFFLGPWHLVLRFIIWPVLVLFLDLFFALFIRLHHLMFGKKDPAERRRAAWAVAALAACVVAYLLTMWSATWYVAVANYAIAVGFIAFALDVAKLRFAAQQKLAIRLGIGVGLVLFVLLAWADRYDERWQNKEGILFVDTHGRFTHRWRHRWVIWPNDEACVIRSMDGPMSPTGRMHGDWTVL